MGGIVFDLSANEGSAVQGFTNIIRAEKEAAAGLSAVENAARRAGEHVEGLGRSAEKGGSHFKAMETSSLGFASSLAGAAGAVVSIGAAVSAVKATVEAEFEAMKRKAQELRGAIQDIAKGTAQAGISLNLFPEAEKFVRETPGGKFDDRQKASIWQKSAEAAGPNAGLEAVRQSFKAALEYGQTEGRDPAAMAETYSQFQKLWGKEVDPQKLNNMAVRYLETNAEKAFSAEDYRAAKLSSAAGLEGDEHRQFSLAIAHGKSLGGESAKHAEKLEQEVLEKKSWEDQKREIALTERDPEAKKRLEGLQTQRETLRKKREADAEAWTARQREYEHQREAVQDEPDAPGRGAARGKDRAEHMKELERGHRLEQEKHEDAEVVARKQDEALAAQEHNLARQKVGVLTPEGQRRQQISTWTPAEKARRVMVGDVGWLPEDVQEDLKFKMMVKDLKPELYTDAATEGAANALQIAQQHADSGSPISRDLRSARLHEVRAHDPERISSEESAAFEKHRQRRSRIVAEDPSAMGTLRRVVSHLPGAETLWEAQEATRAHQDVQERQARGAALQEAAQQGRIESLGGGSAVRVIMEKDESKGPPPNPVAREKGGAEKER